ncbi:MAG: hypothetical protein WCH65_03370 [bacterium]
MNIYFEKIQKSFYLLDQAGTKQSSFMKALEYMQKIANKSEYEVENCFIITDKYGDIIIMMTSIEDASLTITANDNGISYIGKGPKKEDEIQAINTASYSVSDEIFEWIKRNRK